MPDFILIYEFSGEKDIIQVTEADGKYHFGPLDATLLYNLHAEKESYVITGPDGFGDFHAQKLAEIIVKVVDSSNKEPLQVIYHPCTE